MPVPSCARSAAIALVAATTLFISCRKARVTKLVDVVDNPLVHATPLGSLSNETATLFETLPSKITGIDLVHQFPHDASLDMLSDHYSGAGVCIADVDGDDLPDIFFTNYDAGNKLYRNLGEMRFEDITDKAGVDGDGSWSAGPSFVDVDNDGDMDLHVCVFNKPNLLYINNGDGTFVERASDFGLDFVGASVMMSFADYDNDGDLDGYLVTHRLKEGIRHLLPKNTADAVRRSVIQISRGRGARVTDEYRELFELIPKGAGRYALIIAGQEDILFRNDGDRFSVANQSAGISGHGIGLAATWWDYNNDRYPDLYVSNDYKGADQLYRNNGDGTFTDVIEETLPHIPWFSMGSAIADINNDGRLDLLATDMSGTSHFKQKMAMGDMSDDNWFMDSARPPQQMKNALFLNGGSGRMFEVARLTGVSSTDWTWSPKFADFDNDGLVDLFVANGMSRDFMNSDTNNTFETRADQRWKDQPVLREKNLAFRNAGGLSFKSVGKSWGLDSLTASYGASLADLDRDGDLDLVVTNFDEPVSILRNNGQQQRISVQLEGRKSNRCGLGATLTARIGNRSHTRYLNSAQGFFSADEQRVHLGLGDHAFVDELTVRWPCGSIQTLSKLGANRHYVVTEPEYETGSRPVEQQQIGSTRFERSDELSDLHHREQSFDDFRTQPLLPRRLSQLGPAMAVADVDQDGRDDYFLGGASGQPGMLWLSGSRRTIARPFESEAACEDVDALFFDADSDGDPDLYVVSGGVEAPQGDPRLADRLYLNLGEGRLQRAATLPQFAESGGCVCAADVDLDGDLDLFVGGRVQPGAWPLSPPSRILENRAGTFVDATEEIAPALKTVDRATDALWSDVDGDGFVDLLVTREWGAVELYRNQNGKLLSATRLAGLAPLTGLWNAIESGDFDGDGDVDYVVGNLGLNTKYHAGDDHPLRVYYGDFDGSGTARIVEAKYESGLLLPERGKSCSTAAIPSLKPRFPTFESFATAGLTEIYSATCLRDSLELTATTLESGVLLNDGNGRFEFRPLPRLAQVSPTNDIAVWDLNGDRHLDLILAQNDFSPQRETGRMDGGMSLILWGKGDGAFEVVWPFESGLVVPGDARSVRVSDVSGDGRPDLIFGINDERVSVFKANPD